MTTPNPVALAFAMLLVFSSHGLSQVLEPLPNSERIEFLTDTTDAEVRYQLGEIVVPVMSRDQLREMLQSHTHPPQPVDMDPGQVGAVPLVAAKSQPPGVEVFDSRLMPASFNVETGTVGQEETSQPNEKNTTEGEQPGKEAVQDPVARLNQMIDEHTTLAKEDKQIDEATKSHRLEVLASAKSWLQKYQQYKMRLAEFAPADHLEEQRARLEKDLAEFAEPQQPALNSNTTLESLTVRLQTLQKELQSTKNVLEEKNREIEELGRRVTKLPELRSAADDRRRKIEKKLTVVLDQANEESILKKILVDAEKLATEKEIEMLDEEAARQKLRGKVLPLERDLNSRRIKKLEAEIANWEKEVGRMRAAQVAEQARQARLEAINADPALKSLAHRNEELVQLRAKVSRNIQMATEELATVTAKNEDLVEVQQTLKNKIEAAPEMNSANGMLLVETRRNLIAPIESMMRIPKIRTELQGVSQATIQLRNERESLADPQAFVAEQLSITTDSHDESLIKMANEFVLTKRQFLDDLINDYESYRGLLSKVSVERKALVAQISSIREFIDENALWIRSADPFAVKDLRDSRAGLSAFFATSGWTQMGRQLRTRLTHRPHEAALAACGFFALFVFTRRLK